MAENFHILDEDLQEIESKEIQNIRCEMKEIYSIWKEIGLDSEQTSNRVKTAWSHVKHLLQDIKNEEIGLCNELKSKVKNLMEKVSEISTALSIEPSSVVGLTLIERVDVLEQDFNLFSNLMKQRQSELKDLREVEQHYCQLLGIEDYNFSSTTEVPSEANLKELQQHISMLIEEHKVRYEKYCRARQQLSTIFEVTEVVPETTLEKHIFAGKEPLSLTRSTFQEIEAITDKVKRKQEELENTKKELMEKLTLLWQRLNVDNDSRNEFISNHMDCKASTLSLIEQEIVKCEELKQQNIKSFIDAVRKELLDLWTKCGASDSEKELFDPYYSEESTESILAAHEEEVERWKKYHKEVQHILEKIDKRNKLWELLTALDNKANDPDRFKNRGGNLLKEEKERNKLLKTLPTLENEIHNCINLYESEFVRKFYYQGEDYRTLILNQWQKRLISKEGSKLEKQLTTPVKRIPCPTPKSAPCPRLAIYRVPSAKAKITPKSVKKCLPKKAKDVLKEIDVNQNSASSSNATSYPDFETELNRSARKSLRSSVLTSKKIGGTRTPNTSKFKRKNVVKKRVSYGEQDPIDLTSVRGKAGLPFVM